MSKKNKNEVSHLKQFVNSLPVSFPTTFAKDELDRLQSSGMSIEKEVEMEKNYIGRLLKYKGDLSHIKCK